MKKIIFLIVITLMISCGKKKTEVPATIISMQEMKVVLTDIHLAQAAAGNGAVVDSSVFNNKEYLEYILKSHQIKRAEFIKSLNFYSANPELLQEVYDSVLVDLSKIQSESEMR